MTNLLAELKGLFEVRSARLHQLVATADTHAFFLKLHNRRKDIRRAVEEGTGKHRRIDALQRRIALILVGGAGHIEAFARGVDARLGMVEGAARQVIDQRFS